MRWPVPGGGGSVKGVTKGMIGNARLEVTLVTMKTAMRFSTFLLQKASSLITKGQASLRANCKFVRTW